MLNTIITVKNNDDGLPQAYIGFNKVGSKYIADALQKKYTYEEHNHTDIFWEDYHIVKDCWNEYRVSKKLTTSIMESEYSSTHMFSGIWYGDITTTRMPATIEKIRRGTTLRSDAVYKEYVRRIREALQIVRRFNVEATIEEMATYHLIKTRYEGEV